MPTTELPEFREWSIAVAVKSASRSRPRRRRGAFGSSFFRRGSQLANYFARLGLLLVVDEPEGLAYLRQLLDDELPDGYDRLPRLFRRTRLGYDETLLCVLLREVLRRFEEEDLHNERCTVELTTLFDQWRGLSAAQNDEVCGANLPQLAKLGGTGVRSQGRHDEPPMWEIRRILKARLPVAEVENLKGRLLEAAGETKT